jgi:molecular chaperone IbpA
MNAYDFSPLFRSTVGFDRFARLMESALQLDPNVQTYPPYNIETRGEDAYRITLAAAGFSEDELTVEVREDTLVVTGKKAAEEDGATYLQRQFLRKFQLADHVKVKGANLSNGLLSIDLVREVPEEMKPRRIEISTSVPAKLVSKAKKFIEGKSKAA